MPQAGNTCAKGVAQVFPLYFPTLFPYFHILVPYYISITHLPQIAARGRAHYKVYKQDNETETNSHIRRLADEERIEEIAHMLSGATLTDAALNNAKALLGIA